MPFTSLPILSDLFFVLFERGLAILPAFQPLCTIQLYEAFIACGEIESLEDQKKNLRLVTPPPPPLSLSD